MQAFVDQGSHLFESIHFSVRERKQKKSAMAPMNNQERREASIRETIHISHSQINKHLRNSDPSAYEYAVNIDTFNEGKLNYLNAKNMT